MTQSRKLNIQQAAEFLSVGEWYIRKYMRHGLLPRNYDKRGRLIFHIKDLMALLQKQPVAGGME